MDIFRKNLQIHILIYIFLAGFCLFIFDSNFLQAAEKDKKDDELVNVNVAPECLIPYIIIPNRTGPYDARLESGKYRDAMVDYIEEVNPDTPSAIRIGVSNQLSNTLVDVTLMNTKNSSILVPTVIRMKTHKRIIKIKVNLYLYPYSENYFMLQMCGALNKKEMILTYDIHLENPKDYILKKEDAKLKWARTADNYDVMPLTPEAPKWIQFALSLKHVSGSQKSCPEMKGKKLFVLVGVNVVDAPKWIDEKFHPRLQAISFLIREFYADSGLYMMSHTKMSGMLYTEKELERLKARVGAIVEPTWLEEFRWEKIRFSNEDAVLQCWKGNVINDSEGFEYDTSQFIKMEIGKVMLTSH